MFGPKSVKERGNEQWRTLNPVSLLDIVLGAFPKRLQQCISIHLSIRNAKNATRSTLIILSRKYSAVWFATNAKISTQKSIVC